MDYWRFLPEEKDILIQKLTFALPALRGITKATQDEIANAIGVSRQTYNAIEIQKRTMSWNTYISLILFFDYNPNSHIIVCDGMGGLSRGEIASAAVIREFEKWFMKELPFELKRIDMNVIGYKWSLLLRSLNISIQEYGQKFSERLGTTFTGTLFINNQFVVVHVGDTRLYHIDTSLKQMTNDHTWLIQRVRFRKAAHR